MRTGSKSNGCGTLVLVLVFYIYWGIAWVANLIKFIGCDFAEPWREEVIHGVGVFFALPSLITAWL